MAKRIQADQFEVTTTPTTSASTYHLLTRNDSTGVVEKVAPTGFVADSIINGVTDVAPSQNAVFDALLNKAGLSGATFTGLVEVNGNSFKTNGTYILSSGDTGFDAPYGAYFHIRNPGYWESNAPIKASTFRLKNYTVATLPTGVEGDTAYVTDATAPTYLGTLTGGGSVKCPVFFNGTAWVATIESQPKGVRITNATTTGSYAVDWNLGDVWDLTLTGATTITDTNLPSGTNTKVIEFLVTGAFAITFPAYWTPLPSSQTYDGAKVNHIVVSCIVGTGGSEKVFYSNEPTT